MKVAELLSIPQFSDMSIIAGETGINREIHTVNMMDAPDIIHFLHRDEWLVTTAFHLKDHPKLLVELIRAMAEKGCAALGIKTKRFLHEIPKEALLLADELQFPILELPLERSLGEIVNHALRAILNNRETELANALEIHRQFTEFIMKGNGIKQLLRVLSKQISRPVLLYDQYFKPIYTSQRQWAVHLNFNGFPKEVSHPQGMCRA
ncbi:PucR family transcriptional regulator ligand-binding domain-containing protein [Caldibacillus thermoamylovorans]|uniref:PucR family transcriptional regulator ligand-binding domain-containing protein n=1 Tax=Caldibacillus thermoamylovorans TaxID=35841 RepID=UPI00203E28EE|nr:PucR family transcriptional regulator ligand-binding domain-containing protein [Caldibacillus thermoamylovorans]MCM3800074.1 PucR family transcriptional regulator ligand-binding domain-containing protein [Caldibacillus thermoamylovorans]